MKYKIVADSGINLQKLDSKIDYTKVPLTIIAGEKEYIDDTSLNLEEMLVFLKNYKGKSGTACPSVEAWLKSFGDAEAVFCVTITSGLSGSYNSASVAKQDYESAHPDRRVFIVDSLSAGAEMSLIVEKLEELILQGEEFDEICRKIKEYQKNTALLFSLESLTNLANNGRVSPMVAKIAGTLGICVVGCASEVGQLEPMSKCRGKKKVISTLFKHMKEMGYKGGKILIDHCNNQTCVEQLKSLIWQEYPGIEIKTFPTYGLCSFYAEEGGMLVGFEKI